MPRQLVYGNGRLLAACDDRHRIRDLFWPGVGYPNHICGKAVASGIWCDGRMSWLDGPDWQISQEYLPGCLVGVIVFESPALGLRLTVREACDPKRDWLVRCGVLENLRSEARTVKAYWNHELLIDESAIGNTAMHLPSVGGVVHYKRNHCIGFLARSGPKPPTEWSCAVRMNPGEGSWLQCEAGQLNNKGIEVGAVDSTLGIELSLGPNGEAGLTWAAVFGESVDEVEREAHELESFGFEEVLARREARDRERFQVCWSLPDDWQEAAAKALLLIETQTDHRGGILAANDSDAMTVYNTLNYSNVWPRDGALVAEALMGAGEDRLVRNYLEFSLRILPETGLYRQKYWPDGSLGVCWHPLSLNGEPVQPVQLDESCLTLWLACRWAAANPGDELAPRLRKDLIVPIAKALLAYRDERGLPLPSWDLWEERRGVSFFCVATCIAALREAGSLLTRQDFGSAAEKMAKSACRWMTFPDGSFARQLNEEGERDGSQDAAVLAGLVICPELLASEHATPTIAKLKDRLYDKCPIGGMPRYESDYYHRKSDVYPGSPWIITTLWLAQVEMLRGGSREEAERLIHWVLDKAALSGVLAESVHPETGEPLSVSPLTWSHAELLRTLGLWATSGTS